MTWSLTPPADTDNISLGAAQIRTDKAYTQATLQTDHQFGNNDATDGKHKQVTLPVLAADPTLAALTGFIYTKNVGAGVTELFYEDAAGNVKQLTTGGLLNISATEAVLLTGDQTIAGIKTLTSIPVLPASDPTTDNQAARKSYVDGKISGFGDWVDKSSSHAAQQATTAGFVVMAVTGSIEAFTDSNANPTTRRGFCNNSDSTYHCITMPVKKNDYWKVTGAGTINSIFWIPLS